MTDCPCGSGRSFADCCDPYLSGAAPAPTAEALMRSRYCAFATGRIDYLQATLTPETQGDFDRAHTETWSQGSEWTGLDIRSTEDGGPDDASGWVEFVARFRMDGQPHTHHESAYFVKEDGVWYYKSGISGPRPVKRAAPKVGRNDPCPCGSGKKFKKCCGA
jgi:SEC-C motif-containing protein